MAKRLRYPIGVRPLLIEETARRRASEARIVAILERAGFAEVVLPIIDYVEPYAATGQVDGRQSYRFVDRDGELVSVRSDFTPMVARALAPSLERSQLPLRVFYRGDVIRHTPSRLGANRELFQIGAEIIGDDSPGADAEALALVSSILGAFGVTPRVIYTDATIPERLGDGARAALAMKSAAGPGSSPLLSKLIAGSATTADLRNSEETRAIAERLDAIAGIAGPECSAHLDDVDAERGYYTGLRFRAYDTATRITLAQGGRYDSLYGRFGLAAPAVGFTLTIDDLTEER
jgi:ATP phosphoribosyltransferase regulatory subunit